MHIVRRRWRVAAAGMLPIVTAAGFILVTLRSDAERAIGRLKVGMAFDETMVIIGGTYCGGGDFGDGTGWRVWEFSDRSAANVSFKDGRIDRSETRKPLWYRRVHDLLSTILGILSTHC